jgi:hypothetical protein
MLTPTDSVAEECIDCMQVPYYSVDSNRALDEEKVKEDDKEEKEEDVAKQPEPTVGMEASKIVAKAAGEKKITKCPLSYWEFYLKKNRTCLSFMLAVLFLILQIADLLLVLYQQDETAARLPCLNNTIIAVTDLINVLSQCSCNLPSALGYK